MEKKNIKSSWNKTDYDKDNTRKDTHRRKNINVPSYLKDDIFKPLKIFRSRNDVLLARCTIFLSRASGVLGQKECRNGRTENAEERGASVHSTQV